MPPYGHFDDANKEYVITSHFPPVPWINFLTNENFTAIVSQSAGGCAFYRESSSGRLTKYNQVRSTPTDRPGFYLYFREADGTLWCPGFEPVRTPLDRWVCRHGLGYTVFESEYRGLSVTLTFLVPRADNALLWHVCVGNKRHERVDISAFSFVEFNFLWAAREPMYWHWCRFYTSTVFDPALDAVKYDYHVFEDQPKLKVSFSSSRKTASFDCDRNSFLGRTGTMEAPESLRAGRLGNRQLPGGGFAIGALENRIELAPGESTEFVLTLGCGLSWDAAAAIATKYKEPAAAHRELQAVKAYWNDFVDVYQAELPDSDLQRMINLWNPYNCSISFNRKKSMTAFTTGMEKGGVQSRDSSQDSMPLVSLRTDMARDRLLMIYRYQMPSGEFYSTFDPDAGKPADHYAVRSDNGVWPVYTTHAYVAETGDFNFLQTLVPYYQGEPATLLDHMAQGLKHIASRRGRNGLPLIVDVDWNDNLYIFKVDGKEESVMLAQQFAENAKGIKVLAPEKVIKYQAENVNWDTMDKTRLGAVLGVDFVLFISLVEFTTREPGSVNLFRGRIVAEGSVYQSNLPERRARIWHNGSLDATFPLEAPVSGFGGSEGPIRVRTEADFCKALVRKFYTHDINTEDEAKAKRSDFASPSSSIGNI